MLLYDNRSRCRLILQLYGSIYGRITFPMLGMFVYCTALLWIRRLWPDLMPQVDHPFAPQSFGTLIAFAVCFRTNIAWNRFWEACQEVTLMFSKWSDAYSQLQGFINSTQILNPDADFEQLEYYRCELSHLFTVLSAVAAERLTRGDIRRMEMRRRRGVPWSEQVVFRENLRAKDLTNYRSLIPMKVLKVRPVEEDSDEDDSEDDDDDVSEGPHKLESRSGEPVRNAVVSSPTIGALHLKQLKDSWQMPVSILGDCSRAERRLLEEAKDRVALVLLWLNELVTNLQPLLLVPPPILSRVYQELSNGTLGYSQAEKLSDVPFPFIFAQLLALAVLFFALISPVAFTVLTGDSWLTPILSGGSVLSFWALNEIAKELENPFGDEPNNLPLMDAHERFVDFIVDLHGTRFPQDRDPMKNPTASFYMGSRHPRASGNVLTPSGRPSLNTASSGFGEDDEDEEDNSSSVQQSVSRQTSPSRQTSCSPTPPLVQPPNLLTTQDDATTPAPDADFEAAPTYPINGVGHSLKEKCLATDDSAWQPPSHPDGETRSAEAHPHVPQVDALPRQAERTTSTKSSRGHLSPERGSSATRRSKELHSLERISPTRSSTEPPPADRIIRDSSSGTPTTAPACHSLPEDEAEAEAEPEVTGSRVPGVVNEQQGTKHTTDPDMRTTSDGVLT